VLSAAAGLFVDPAPGPVLANYGLESLRFVKPVYIGDTIRRSSPCKQKTAKETPPGRVPQGVVAWDVEVTNQANETVAVYTILTLVKRLVVRRGRPVPRRRTATVRRRRRATRRWTLKRRTRVLGRQGRLASHSEPGRRRHRRAAQMRNRCPAARGRPLPGDRAILAPASLVE
jgi:hypothetical protein